MTDISISRNHRSRGPAGRDHARLPPSVRFARANPNLRPQPAFTKRTQEPSSSDTAITCTHRRRDARKSDPLSRAEGVGEDRGKGTQTNPRAAGPAWINDLAAHLPVAGGCRREDGRERRD